MTKRLWPAPTLPPTATKPAHEMALPWGKQSSSSVPASGELEVSIVRWGERSARNSNVFAPGKLPVDGSGCFTAPPGAPYLIDIALRHKIPRGELRVVRVSIDGREINEQVVLRSGSGTARFCGWMEDPSGAKRIQFTFPPNGQSVIQVGVRRTALEHVHVHVQTRANTHIHTRTHALTHEARPAGV